MYIASMHETRRIPSINLAGAEPTLDTPQIKHVHAHIVLQECQAEPNSVWCQWSTQAGKIRQRKVRDTALSSFRPCRYAFPHNHVMLLLLIRNINFYKRDLGHRHGSCMPYLMRLFAHEKQ